MRVDLVRVDFGYELTVYQSSNQRCANAYANATAITHTTPEFQAKRGRAMLHDMSVSLDKRSSSAFANSLRSGS